jgi:hypothetical protein
MFSPRFNLHVLDDVSWWHWTLSIPLLVAHVSGVSWAILIAIALCCLVAIFYIVKLRKIRPFPVQVRLAYFVLLALGTLPGWQWLHLVQIVGTTTMVTVGYCPLARLLKLLPYNRTDALSANLLWRTMVGDPCIGGFVCCTIEQVGEGPLCSTIRKFD